MGNPFYWPHVLLSFGGSIFVVVAGVCPAVLLKSSLRPQELMSCVSYRFSNLTGRKRFFYVLSHQPAWQQELLSRVCSFFAMLVGPKKTPTNMFRIESLYAQITAMHQRFLPCTRHAAENVTCVVVRRHLARDSLSSIFPQRPSNRRR